MCQGKKTKRGRTFAEEDMCELLADNGVPLGPMGEPLGIG